LAVSANGEAGAARGRENRRAVRQRTRLRPCKLFDAGNKLLVECALYDISATGARVRIFADLPLPTRLRLFDEREITTRDAEIAWRNKRELGLRFV
jgi:hypothetical protein